MWEFSFFCTILISQSFSVRPFLISICKYITSMEIPITMGNVAGSGAENNADHSICRIQIFYIHFNTLGKENISMHSSKMQWSLSRRDDRCGTDQADVDWIDHAFFHCFP